MTDLNFISAHEVLDNTIAQIDNTFHGVTAALPTPWKSLNDVIGGFNEGDLIVLGSRPGIGKSAMAMNIAANVAIKIRAPVAYVSLEAPALEVGHRLLALQSRVEIDALRDGGIFEQEDWQRVTAGLTILAEANLLICDALGANVYDLEQSARDLAGQHGPLGLLVVDSMDLMLAGGATLPGVQAVVFGLKRIARELYVPVLVTSQLSGQVEKRNEKRPVVSDCADAVQQDADLVLLLYRDEVYYPDTPDKGVAELYVAKNRRGSMGNVKLNFLGGYMLFQEITPDVYDDEC